MTTKIKPFNIDQTQDFTFGNVAANSVTLTTGIVANGSIGAKGDVLVSDGTKDYWAAPTSVAGLKGDKGEAGYIGADGAKGDKGDTGAKGDKGVDGVIGVDGLPGGDTYEYVYITTTTDSNPGQGKLGFSNTYFPDATFLHIHQDDANIANTYGFLVTADDSSSSVRGHVKLYDSANIQNFVAYAITGAQVYNAQPYFTIPVTHLAGTVTTFANNTGVAITYSRTGDKGSTGATGTKGDKGDAQYIGNLDGGTPSTTYVGITSLDAGGI